MHCLGTRNEWRPMNDPGADVSNAFVVVVYTAAAAATTTDGGGRVSENK